MPRPRLVKEYDLRVTPPNGQDLEFPLDEFDQFIACKEFGHINKKKHYHIFCKTTMNDDEVKKYLRTVCDVEVTTGNQLYRVKKAHEGTIGYVIKEQDVVASKGFTEDQLSEFIQQSLQYRRSLESQRRSQTRNKDKKYDEIVDEIVAELPDRGVVAADISQKILSKFLVNGKRLPPRSSHDSILLTIIAKKYGVNKVMTYYDMRCFTDMSWPAVGRCEFVPTIFSVDS